MYQIKAKSIGIFTAYQLVHEASDSLIELVPECGARISRMRLAAKEEAIDVLVGDTDAKALQINKGYKSAILFPFPNRIKDGKYSFENEAYDIPQNRAKEQNAIHGLVYNRAFEVTDQQANEKGAAITMAFESKGCLHGYPFPFILTLTYELNEQGFSCELKVKNTGRTKMPFAFGWHPYFTLGIDTDDCYLQIPAQEYIELDAQQKVPTGNRLPMTDFAQRKKIGEQSLDHCFPIFTKSRIARTFLAAPSKGLQLEVWQIMGNRQFNYVQVYTPADRKSVAIEPMTANVDCLNNQEGLITLLANEDWTSHFGVKLHA